MKLIIMVEPRPSMMDRATRSLVQAARALSHDITLLTCCALTQEQLQTLALIPGVTQVLHVPLTSGQSLLPEQAASVVAGLSMDYDTVMAASSTFGQSVLPRIAAQWDVEQISNVTQILDAQTFQHPIYAGNAMETVKMQEPRKVLSVRLTAFTPVEGEQAPCPIVEFQGSLEDFGVQWLGLRQIESVRPELTQANIVVSGGRGLQSREQFALIEQLADKLGAAVGASRAAVDAGFISNDHQVGQTGKVVAPSLYIAAGISGAVQHLAGMKDAKVIVAINQDADAPIFQVADYGLVGDLFKIIPELLEKI